MIDYLIVGQGLAGTWLTYFLLKKGKTVKVVDQFNPNSASNVASGIINPITGRRLVKSWKMDTLLPFARQSYQQLEKELQTSFFHEYPIVWLLSSVQELNNFNEVGGRAGYEAFVKEIKMGVFHPHLLVNKGYAKMQQTAFVQVDHFITSFRNYLINKELLLSCRIDYKDITIEDDAINWNGIRANKIIFCEGHRAVHNPYFKELPFQPAKGEVLIVKIAGLGITDVLLKSKVFLVPLGEDIYWVGSTYVWDDQEEQTSEKARMDLCRRLEKVISLPYEIVDQKAGVRPTTKQRRPFLGLHPEHTAIGIFNGLGTKGVSLSPYFAAQFAEYLTEGAEIEKEANIAKYFVFKS